MASTALKGTVFAFWLFFPCIFINYCDYRVNHREFLWLVVASQCQMSSDINILYHSYQQLVHITRNGLNTKCSLHFSAYFTFLFILVNFPLTGNDICHSQPKPWYFIISNASHSINLFLAQWRHISSESAVFTCFCYNIWQQNVLAVLIAKLDAQLKAWDILLVLTSVAGNLCNKCPSGYSNKTAVKVILSMRSLVSIKQQSTRRPCDILVANVGPEVAKTAKTAKCVKKCAKLKMFKTALLGVSQQRSVSECCARQFRPVQAQRPCPALSSLLQLTPARPGPRSLAQLPRGPGRVPIVQGASQRSYRAQEPWQCPGMCLGGAHGHIHLQPIGTVPRLKNCKYAECLKTPGKTLSWTFYFFYLTFKSKSLVFTFVSQEVSHIGFLLPVSHVCLQIAFPVSHIGFTISPNFDNLTVKWKWRLICGWITATLCLVWVNIPLFPIDFNGKPEIFLKHLKKKIFF